MASTYHPTADQAILPIRRLLDNERMEIGSLVDELNKRAYNEAKLSVSLALMERTIPTEEPKKTETETKPETKTTEPTTPFNRLKTAMRAADGGDHAA